MLFCGMNVVEIDVDDLLPLWQMSLAAANKSQKTINGYIIGVNQYVTWLRDHDRPVTLNRRSVEEWSAYLLKTLEPSTVRARQVALRQFSKWLVAEHEIPVDELIGMPAAKLDEKIVEPLTADELQRVLKACQGTSFRARRDDAMIRLMAETGARAAEICDMRVEDVDLKEGIATIVRGKGGKGRLVAFGEQTALALGYYLRMRKHHRLAHTPNLWLGGGGQTFSYAGMQVAFRHRGQLAGVPRLHPHLMRHGLATRWMEAGGSESGLMSICGWRSHDMLLRYSRAGASQRAIAESRKLKLGNI